MNHGKEISQKIRSAIKAKLIELNAYVDDELPDYIMVMVANKKPKSQMNEDLSLFLGNNTNKFTEWLHSLLEKLQSLGSDQQKSKEIESSSQIKDPSQSVSAKDKLPSKQGISEKSKKVKEKPPNSSKTDGATKDPKSKSKSKTDAKASTAKEKVQAKEKVVKAAGLSTTEKKVSAEAKPIKAVKRSATAAALQDEDVLTELLGNRAETDEFSAEFKEEPELKKTKKSAVAGKTTVKTSPKTPASESIVKALSTSDLRSRMSSAKSPTEQPKPGSVHSRLGVPRSLSGEGRERRNIPRAITSPIRRVSDPEGRRVQRPEAYREVHPVRRRQPMSYVGKIRSREFEEEDEDEEDTPHTGGMSSVIAVTARKSSVPLSQQANKNLILRATKEAEKSVTSKLKSVLNEEKMYSGKMYSEKERALVRPIQQGGDKKVTVTLHGKRSGRVIGQVAAQARPSLGMGLVSKSKREELELLGPGERRVGLASKSKREEIIRGMTYTIDNKAGQKPKPLQQTKTTSQGIARVRPVVDNRLILKQEEVEGGSNEESVEGEDLVYEEEVDQVVYSESPEGSEELDLEGIGDDDDIDPEIQQILQAEDSETLVKPSLESPDAESLDAEVQGQDEGAESSEEILEKEQEIDKEDEVHDDDDEEEQRRKLLRQQKMLRQKTRAMKRRQQLEMKRNPKKQKPTAEVPPADTRFIVTLDGVDPDSYPMGDNSEMTEAQEGEEDMPQEEVEYQEEEMEEVQYEMEEMEAQNAALLKMRPPEIKPISISLKDTDDEDEEGEVLPSTLAKSMERCRFWPACVNGNACPYVHPTQPCKMFPQCKFADKCLYIHPNCKYDSKCTRKDCPFTHASKRSNFTTVIQKIVPVPVAGTILGGGAVGGYSQSKSSAHCRFYPNCTNMNCTFIHPKPCKFGLACKNKNTCSFYHPPLPTKDKLTWTAGGKQDTPPSLTSTRQFDAGPAKKMPTHIVT